MLDEISIRNFGILQSTAVNFETGLNVITGETGSGKSMLLGALKLIAGEKIDSSIVSKGSMEAIVEARFVGESLEVANDEIDLTTSDEELVVRRTIPMTGRSRSYINGSMASQGDLQQRMQSLMVFQSQHAQQTLLTAAAQRTALDDFGAVDSTAVVELRKRIRQLDDEMATLGGDDEQRQRQVGLMQFELAQLEEAELSNPNEDDELVASEELLAGVVEHRESGMSALALLNDDGGASDSLGRARTQLGDTALFVDVSTELSRLCDEVRELTSTIRSILDALDDDPSSLAAVQQRRHLLGDLKRRYNKSLEQLIAHREYLRSEINRNSNVDARRSEIALERSQIEEQLTTEERKLCKLRKKAAVQLGELVTSQLQDLALAGSQFEIAVDGSDGSNVEFRFSANAGTATESINKVASGGELSRVMLALRVVLLQQNNNGDNSQLLVFDEVDAGIGGEAGIAVGKALSRLSQKHQVLVISHLPQVAAFADAHFAISKKSDSNSTVATVEKLDHEGSIKEISRMLAGVSSASARDHAEELLSLRNVGAK